MNPSPRLALRMLGGFALERDALPCKLAYVKGRALLAFLAAEPGRAHSRESLATMLWPDMIRELALTNFRQVLHDLRHTLNAAGLVIPPLQVDRETIRLDPSSDLVIDTTAFFAPAPACLAMPCPANCASCCERMETLAGCYRGEFMSGISLPECPDFEEWLHIQRETLHLRAIALLARLSDCHERMGTHAKSLPFALRFLGLEPWNEDGLRRTMRLYALNGQRDAALAQYETCCRALKRELGVLPSEETFALAERIRCGELSPVVNRLPTPAPASALPLPVTELRQITVLYCELAVVGVEDPDDALVLLRAPQARCCEIIRSYSGHFVQTYGGSLLVYFGYPQACENAARLAVRAALAMMRAEFPGIALRAGIHTGMVISSGHHVPDAIGSTSGLAIRLRQLAGYGELTISAATHCLIAGYFECMSLGVRQLPDILRPLEVFKVGRDSGAKDRIEAAAKLSPLVGRQEEISALLAMWRDTRRGSRHIMMLCGEAGIGKSRLLFTFKDILRKQTCVVHELRCFLEHNQTPFYPLATLYGFALGFSPEDTPEAKFEKLADHVEAHYPKTDQEAVPLLAKMLALPLRAPYLELTSSPQLQREKTLVIVLERLYALAKQQPVLLVIEDLHWADPSTLELLKRFITTRRGAPVMAVLTARPGFQPPWQECLARTLTLDALDDAKMVALIAAVAPEIESATVRRIVERADGIPLFAEEMAKIAALDNQASIPVTLHDLLAARLDRMGEAKRTAQLAATIGREFDLDLLRKVSTCAPAVLVRTLSALQDAGLILKVSDTAHQFKHALIQEAAYQSQARVERQAAHRRIAQVLQNDFPAIVMTRPELLAQHLSQGGETHQSIEYWIKAGQRAALNSANLEAVAHFKSGLALVEALPDDQERVRLELDLQIRLGATACAAQGYASADGANAFARAMTLCNQHESGSEMFQSIWGLWASASSRAGYASALELAQQLLRMASQSGDPVQNQQGHFAVADTLYWQGEFAGAREHLECVMALYQPAHHDSHVAQFGEDVGVTGGSYLSWVQWFLGFPDRACKASAQTLTLARQRGHPYSLAYALTFAAILHCRLRQPEKALTLAEETLGLANNHGFPLWQIGATIVRGWALAMQNRGEGVETLQQCVEMMRAAMGGVTLVVMGPLLEASVALSLFDAAQGVSDETFAVGSAIGDHHIEAELHRLKGEALLGLCEDNAAQAEACFDQALTASRRQQAKSLELRAATSMARLWQKQGKGDDARRLLEEIYRRFTEGFDTPDLRDARTLLDSLGV